MKALFFAAALAATIPHAHATPADTLSKLSGMHERQNRAQLKKSLGVDPARVPWCGYAVAYAIRKASPSKKPPAGYPRAISWARWGKAVTLSSARRGDVVVVKNRRGHHVALITSASKGKVCMIGGNQSSRVSEKCVSARSVVAVRR